MRMKRRSRTISLLLVAALLVAALPLAACAAGDTPTGDSPIQPTRFTFSESSIAVTQGDAGDYQIDGTKLSITGPGHYTLSGSCSDGSVTVKKGVTGVQLTLDGLDLTSAQTAPLVCAKSSQVTIEVAEGTENTLSDTEQNNDEVHTDNLDAENAVIKCKDGSQVALCGTGTLNIVSKGKNGIKSGMTTETEGEAWMTIDGLTLNITASVNDAINAEEKLDVLGGKITISAADDAIHCDRTLNIGASGTVGPTIQIDKCYEGLEGADLTVFSGDITIHSEDDGINAANSDLTGYPFTLTIAGGKVLIDTTAGDGIDSNGTLTITGGNVQVYGTSNGDNAPLDTDGAFTITGGTVLALGMGNMAQEPSETQAFVSFGGRGGMMGMPQGGGGHRFPGGRGEVTIPRDPNAPKPMETQPDSGDGQTPPQMPDGQTPPEGMTPPDGQTPPQMPDGQTPPEGQEPPQGMGGGTESSLSFAQGDELTIKDSAGKTLASATALRSGNYVFFSSPEVADGEDYELYVAGEKVLDATAATQGAGMGFPGGGQTGFQDVSREDWFFEAVEFVRAKGLMTGVSRDSFSPQGTTTRGMIWTVLARLSGEDTSGGDTWYAKGQAWAVANGISDGSAPEREVSREELLTMLYRYAKKLGTVTEGLEYAMGYSDEGELHSWAVEAARWWSAKGVVTGKGGKLVPQGKATRAETAAMLQRYCQL